MANSHIPHILLSCLVNLHSSVAICCTQQGESAHAMCLHRSCSCDPSNVSLLCTTNSKTRVLGSAANAMDTGNFHLSEYLLVRLSWWAFLYPIWVLLSACRSCLCSIQCARQLRCWGRWAFFINMAMLVSAPGKLMMEGWRCKDPSFCSFLSITFFFFGLMDCGKVGKKMEMINRTDILVT